MSEHIKNHEGELACQTIQTSEKDVYLSGGHPSKFDSKLHGTANSLLSKRSRLGFFLRNTWLQLSQALKAAFVKMREQKIIRNFNNTVKRRFSEMIGAIEKGMAQAAVARIPEGVYGDVDLRTLPKYICFRAALLRQKTTLTAALCGLGGLFVLYFGFSRYEISSLYDRLRAKEYILAPGVIDFTAAAPQSVSDTYVNHAVMEFISQFGTVSPATIDEQYERLATSMSQELAVKFRAEAQEWKAKVKQENISEIVAVTSRRIVSDERGSYNVTAMVKTSTYVGNESLGAREEVVEMSMHLVAPRDGKRWFLEITSLGKHSKEAYKVQKTMEGR